MMMSIYLQAKRKQTPTMMDLSMLNHLQAAQARKGRTDEIVAHLELYE